jgi:spore cortex biosynthesis protein YabQ
MGYIDVPFQIITFLFSLLLGGCFCIIYDVVRVLHKFYANGFLEVLVIDILYWLIITVVSFCFLVIRCHGMIRGYVFLGCLIGFLVVRLTISNYLIKIFSVICNTINKFLSIVKTIINTILSFVEKLFKKMKIVVKKGLQDKAKLLYNHFKLIIIKKRRGDNGCSN